MNPVEFVYTDLTQYGFAGTGSVNNLYDYNPASAWSSSFVGNQSLNMNFANDVRYRNKLVINGHNIFAFEDVYLESSPIADFSFIVTSVRLDDTAGQILTASFASDTSEYWRIRYSGGPAPYIGGVFLDYAFSVPFGYTFGYKKDDYAFDTQMSVGIDGQLITAQAKPGKRTGAFTFQFMSDVVRNGFVSFLRSIRGKLLPYYMIHANGDIMYSRMQQDYSPISALFHGFSSLEEYLLEEFIFSIANAPVIVPSLRRLNKTFTYVRVF